MTGFVFGFEQNHVMHKRKENHKKTEREKEEEEKKDYFNWL